MSYSETDLRNILASTPASAVTPEFADKIQPLGTALSEVLPLNYHFIYCLSPSINDEYTIRRIKEDPNLDDAVKNSVCK